MIVRPFTGRLVAPEWAARVVAPMSDGLAAADRAALMNNGESFLGVTRPVPADASPQQADEWLAANRTALASLLARGAFGTDRRPRLLVYRMHVADRSHTGLIVEVMASAFADHRVRGHESVAATRVDSLARQYEAVPVQAEMVALIHDHDEYVEGLIDAALAATPVLAFVDVAGVGQEVWEITDPAIVEAACGHLSRLGLYIADGHHRVAAAVRRHEASGGPVDETLLAVAYPAHQLHLFAFHRYLRGPVEVLALLDHAGAVGTLTEVVSANPRPGVVGIYCAGRWFELLLAATGQVGAAALDVSRLHHDLLDPFVGWELGARLETVPELLGVGPLVDRADSNGGAVFALAPPTMAELMSVADRGEVMLAKSTFFDPKPRGGLVLIGAD